MADDFEPRRDRMQQEALRDGWIVPRAVYGYFRAVADGDDVVVTDPRRRRTGAVRVPAPGSSSAALPQRLPAPRRRRPRGRGGTADRDRRTRGDRAHRPAAGRRRVQRGVLRPRACGGGRAKGSPSSSTAASGAELGLDAEQGRRYSWGYPGLSRPRAARAGAATCCRRRQAIGLELSAAYQFIPEQTTAAIVDAPPGRDLLQRPPRRALLDARPAGVPRGPGRSERRQCGRGRARRSLRAEAQNAITAMPISSSPMSSAMRVNEVPSPVFAATAAGVAGTGV